MHRRIQARCLDGKFRGIKAHDAQRWRASQRHDGQDGIIQQMKLPPDRQFGTLFTIVFAVLAGLNFYRGGHAYTWLAIVAGLFGVVTLVRPSLLRPLNRLWMLFAELLHRIVSPVVLGAIFYVVLTPVGAVQRVMGRDTMRRKLDAQARSYWIPRVPPGPPSDSLRNQF